MKTATTLYLVRHGETAWNRRGIYQGTTDVPLSATGEAQAEQLATTLRDVVFDAGYTSPLRRARETAEKVLRGRVPLVEVRDLREISYGLWQGRGMEPAGRCSPGLEWRWRENPWSVRFPGGETLEEVHARGTAALEGILAVHQGDTVLVSGHGHLNRVLLIHALGWPRERFWEIQQPNSCYTRLCFDPDGASLLQ